MSIFYRFRDITTYRFSHPNQPSRYQFWQFSDMMLVNRHEASEFASRFSWLRYGLDACNMPTIAATYHSLHNLACKAVLLRLSLIAGASYRDRPNFVFVFGAENKDFDWFRSFRLRTKMYFVVFRVFFRFRPKTHPFSAGNVDLGSLQSVCQRQS